jgi:hypothetical protein
MVWLIVGLASPDFFYSIRQLHHRRMASGGHGLLKVSPRPAMFNPFMPYRRATPKTASRTLQGWPVCRAYGMWPSSTLSDTPGHRPMISICKLRLFH